MKLETRSRSGPQCSHLSYDGGVNPPPDRLVLSLIIGHSLVLKGRPKKVLLHFNYRYLKHSRVNTSSPDHDIDAMCSLQAPTSMHQPLDGARALSPTHTSRETDVKEGSSREHPMNSGCAVP